MADRKKDEDDGEGWGRLAHVVHHFIGEVCCVTTPIKEEKVGFVRIWGSEFPAKAESDICRGRWVKVISHTKGVLNVTPLNVWLGSCCR